jgi:hypothetical protein
MSFDMPEGRSHGDMDYENPIPFERMDASVPRMPVRRRAGGSSQAINNILWARRQLDQESTQQLYGITSEVVQAAGFGDTYAFRGMGASALTSTMARRLAHDYYEGDDPREKIGNYERALRGAIKNQDGTRDPLFVQFGGAVIFGAKQGSSKSRQIGMEIISGTDELLDERTGLIRTLAPVNTPFIEKRGFRTSHVSLAHTNSWTAAVELRDRLNESDAVAMWVGLSGLKAIRAGN